MEVSKKRSVSGKLGALAKQNLASAKQNLAKPSKGKEIKRKEKKLNIRNGQKAHKLHTGLIHTKGIIEKRLNENI